MRSRRTPTLSTVPQACQRILTILWGRSKPVPPGAPSFSRTLRKEPALSEAEGVGDGDHRCTLLTRALQESARNPTRETTVESHPSKNEGRGTRLQAMTRLAAL